MGSAPWEILCSRFHAPFQNIFTIPKGSPIPMTRRSVFPRQALGNHPFLISMDQVTHSGHFVQINSNPVCPSETGDLHLAWGSRRSSMSSPCLLLSSLLLNSIKHGLFISSAASLFSSRMVALLTAQRPCKCGGLRPQLCGGSQLRITQLSRRHRKCLFRPAQSCRPTAWPPPLSVIILRQRLPCVINLHRL